MTKSSKKSLLLEDQFLIVMDIEDSLRKRGYEDINIISSCADADKWLQENTPDIAIIDVHLRDGICAGVAQILNDRAVPFFVHSALDPKLSGDPVVFANGRWISKPCLPESLASIVEETIGAA